MKKLLFQRLLLITALAFCITAIILASRHKIHLFPKPITQTKAQNERIITYSLENVQEESDNFNRFTTYLIPSIIESSPLSATFMYGNLQALGLEALMSELDQMGPENFQAEADRAGQVITALKAMDYDLLSDEQKSTYEMLLFQNQLVIENEPFTYYDSIIEPSSGIQTNLPLSLIQIELNNAQEIEAYLARLNQLPRLFNQLIEYEEVRIDKDLLLPPNQYKLVSEQIDGILVAPEDFMLYLDFVYKINAVKDMKETQKDAYKAQCLTLIKNDIYPAYDKLKVTLKELEALSSNDLGVCSWNNGKAYYEHLIHKETSYDLSGEALRSWVTNEMKSCLSQIKSIYVNNTELLKIDNLNELLPTYDSLDELYAIEDQCLNDMFYDYGIERASEYIIPAYLEDYVAAGFYFPVSIDGTQYGNMYLQEKAYTTLDASTLELYFHENIPGHHFYFSKFYGSDLPLIRKVSSWLPYEEGWAQYIQNVSIEYFGLSEPLTKLLKASSKLTYYYMLLIDLEYHYDGISQADAINKYIELGYSPQSAQKAVTRMIAHPGEIIHYIYGGYKIEGYRTQCEIALGNRFDIKSFHDMILDNAELPFTTMDKIVNDYITSQLK